MKSKSRPTPRASCLPFQLALLPLCLSLLLAWVGSSTTLHADDPVAVPSEEAQAEAMTLLQDIYAQEFQSRDPEVKAKLAQALLTQANDPNNDDTVRYVLLKQAAMIAAETGKTDTAMVAVEQIEGRYRAQTSPLRMQILDHLQRNASSPEDYLALAMGYAQVVPFAIREDNFDAARQAVQRAGTAASRSRNRELMAELRPLTAVVRDAEQAFRTVAPAFETLKRDPADPNANLAVGRYLCLVKGDWASGLPHLAKGSNPTFAGAAQTDLAEPSQTESRLALADVWYDLAEKETDAHAKAALLVRAGQYYEMTVADLGGLEKVRIERRIEEGNEARSQLAAGSGGIELSVSAAEPMIFSPSGHASHRSDESITNTISGNPAQKWCFRHHGRDVIWQVNLPRPVRLTQYALTSANDAPARDPRRWRFEASRDGTNWEVLDTQANQGSFPARHHRIEYPFQNPRAYAYYRLVFTPSSRPPLFQIGEIEFPEFSLKDIPVKQEEGTPPQQEEPPTARPQPPRRRR